MGKLIRRNTTFTRTDLPKLVDYDVTPLIQTILKVPSLRAFYDATNLANMTVDGSNNVTLLKDLSANGLDFVQADTLKAPVYSATALNGQPGIYFNGTKHMTAASLFSGESKGTSVMFIAPTGADGTSQRVLADASNAFQYFSVSGTSIKAFVSSTFAVISSIASKEINFVCAWDSVTDTATINGEGITSVGTMGAYGSPSGSGNLGKAVDGSEINKYIGYIGHIMLFDEDLSANPTVMSLVNEYALRRYRL